MFEVITQIIPDFSRLMPFCFDVHINPWNWTGRIAADLRHFENRLQATNGMDDVCQLAADMGGIGYITANRAFLTRNNAFIDSHLLEAARVPGVRGICTTVPLAYIPSSFRTPRM